MFLKISNSGKLNRNFLKLVGFTTKRDLPDDDRTIGIFGSGTKAATVAALRLGYGLVITSVDHLGPYSLSFDWQTTDLGGGQTTRQIRFLYRHLAADGSVTRTEEFWDMTLDAFKDWDKPIGSDKAGAFKVLREFICNAFDEDPEFRIDWVEDDEAGEFAQSDETCVYLSQTHDIQFVFEQVERYFKFLAQDHEPLVSLPGVGRIYPKTEGDNTRLFVRGVLISSTNDSWSSTLLDYDLDSKNLISEDRTVKNMYDYKLELGKLVANVGNKELAKKLLEAFFANQGAKLEDASLGYIYKLDDAPRAVWLQALTEMFCTDRLCVATGNRITDQDAAQVYGYVVLNGSWSFKIFLNRVLGIPKADKVAKPRIEYSLLRFEDLDQASQERFKLAFRVFARTFPDRADIPIVFFLPKNEEVRRRINGVAGMGEDNFKESWISALSESELRLAMDLLRCLNHETRHVLTRAYDYDRKFVEAAEDDILRLQMRVMQLESDLNGSAVLPLGDADKNPNIVRPLIFYDDEGNEILGLERSEPSDPCFEELLNIERQLSDKDKE